MGRRQKALACVDLADRGLETGPYENRFLPSSSGARVESVDRADGAELVRKYRGHGTPQEIAAIEDADRVWIRGSLVDLVGEADGSSHGGAER